jgi:chromosomal replication initiation ATPase DnaA
MNISPYIIPGLKNTAIPFQTHAIDKSVMMKVVCRYYNTTEDKIFIIGRGRKNSTNKKHVAFYFLYTHCRMTYKQIADLGGYHHTSIMNALCIIRSKVSSVVDSDEKRDVRNILNLLTGI